MSNQIIYFVQSTRHARTISAKNVSFALISEIAKQQKRFELITDLELDSFSPPAGSHSFVCFDSGALRLVKSRFKQCFGINTFLILCPTDFPLADQNNDEVLSDAKKVLDRDDVVLTDSELSRYVIESFMNHMRLQVEVVVPRHSRDTAESMTDSFLTNSLSWSFQAAKGDPSAERLRAPGLDWSRSTEIPVSTGGVVQGPRYPQEARGQSNEELVARLFDNALSGEAPLSVGVLGHKLTFIDELAGALARKTGSHVQLDEWKYLSGPSDKNRAESILSESDVIIGEWARPNNVWIQDNAPAEKPLIVRAHRYEVTTDFPRAIDIERFRAAVVIVPWVGRVLVQEFGWPAEKIVYIPNFVNNSYFRRRKLPGSNFTLGMVGITPHLKRLDLALDLLKELRRIDPRFNLRVRGGDPTKHPHWTTDPAMREQWGSIQARMRFDPYIRDGLHFDEEGRDMAGWFQQIGFILSTSDLEGSHVALAEGVVSGAIPIARRWPGIETLWPESVIHDEFDEAVAFISKCSEPTVFQEVSAKISTLKSLDSTLVLQAWWHLLNGRVSEAQRVFGPVDWFAPMYEAIEAV